MLYRLFPYDPEVPDDVEGGALFVPRALQGRGRHDVPDSYGALYASRSVVSVVAERLQRFRGRPVGAEHLTWERGLPFAIAAIDDDELELLDLDEPRELESRALRPSVVATRDRRITRRYARGIHGEGRDGFAWWSTIEASWSNVTLFAERVRARLALAGEPEPLGLGHPAVREAAEAVGVLLASPAS